MELSRIILGTPQTEKSERLKMARTYVLTVHPAATKIDVKNALKTFFDVDVSSVRVMRTGSKQRLIGAGKAMVKRHPSKRVYVTLAEKSDALDLTKFKTS